MKSKIFEFLIEVRIFGIFVTKVDTRLTIAVLIRFNSLIKLLNAEVFDIVLMNSLILSTTDANAPITIFIAFATVPRTLLKPVSLPVTPRTMIALINVNTVPNPNPPLRIVLVVFRIVLMELTNKIYFIKGVITEITVLTTVNISTKTFLIFIIVRCEILRASVKLAKDFVVLAKFLPLISPNTSAKACPTGFMTLYSALIRLTIVCISANRPPLSFQSENMALRDDENLSAIVKARFAKPVHNAFASS